LVKRYAQLLIILYHATTQLCICFRKNDAAAASKFEIMTWLRWCCIAKPSWGFSGRLHYGWVEATWRSAVSPSWGWVLAARVSLSMTVAATHVIAFASFSGRQTSRSLCPARLWLSTASRSLGADWPWLRQFLKIFQKLMYGCTVLW